MEINKLLERQLKKVLGDNNDLPEKYNGFLKVISDSYDHNEKDRKMLERTIELNSKELVELNQNLKVEKEELKKLNLELDKFVYSVSHDLRAPLKSMGGIVEITEEISEDPMVKEHMEMLKTSISKLDCFITDMLDYSRNARAEIRKEEIDFKELLNDITNNLKHMGGNHRLIKIEVDVNHRNTFHSDTNRIKVLLNNLVSNAIRYQNPEIADPFVKINVDTSDIEVNIIVKDNGIGISKELHTKIFEMFYRVTENSVGSGVGLSLVKETVEKLNGKIVVDSEPGIGTQFSLNIPNLFSNN